MKPELQQEQPQAENIAPILSSAWLGGGTIAIRHGNKRGHGYYNIICRRTSAGTHRYFVGDGHSSESYAELAAGCTTEVTIQQAVDVFHWRERILLDDREWCVVEPPNDKLKNAGPRTPDVRES